MLKSEPLNDSVSIFLSDDLTLPGATGTWSECGVDFAFDFDGSYSIQSLLQQWGPRVSARPARATAIIRQLSAESWLLDVCFTHFHATRAENQEIKDSTLFRAQLIHRRLKNPDSQLPEPTDVASIAQEILSQIETAKDEIESEVSDIEDFISTLEDAKGGLEERLTELTRSADEADRLADEAKSAQQELGEAITNAHKALIPLEDAKTSSVEGTEPAEIISRSTIAPPPEIVKPPEEEETASTAPSDPIWEAWSRLRDAEEEAESLDLDIDGIETHFDDRIREIQFSLWTHYQYVRGQSFLRDRRQELAEVRFSFLGNLEPALSRMTPEALIIARSSVLLVNLAHSSAFPTDLDYGCVIASMAKCCERILEDILDERMASIENDSTVKLLLDQRKNWNFGIPPTCAGVGEDQLKSVIGIVKKAIADGKRPKWSGMGARRLAVILFGGWISIVAGSHRVVLNPLGINATDGFVQQLPANLHEMQNARNPAIHRDLASFDDLARVWACFQDCLRGLLRAFYGTS